MAIWHDHKRRAWAYSPLSSVGDLLMLEGALLKLRAESVRSDRISGEAMRDALRGLAAHVTHMDGEPVTVDLMDAELPFTQVMELIAVVKDGGGLDARTTEHIRAALDVQADGGCECPACTMPEDDPRRARIADILAKSRVRCRYGEIDAHVWSIIGHASSFDHGAMDMPIWLYQAIQIRQRVIGRRQHEQLKKMQQRDKNKSVDEELKRRGAWR